MRCYRTAQFWFKLSPIKKYITRDSQAEAMRRHLDLRWRIGLACKIPNKKMRCYRTAQFWFKLFPIKKCVTRDSNAGPIP